MIPESQVVVENEVSEPFKVQELSSAFHRLVSFVRAPLLIGIGSGIGNMLHVGPMVRNIALRTGQPIDIVVSQDHTESLFILNNPLYINAVHSLGFAILDRHYDTVFLTHSFGNVQLPFSCDRMLRSRNWDRFKPGQSPHETIFNLEAAKALLGIEYNDEDIHTHYISNISYRWHDSLVVGIHGGSKSGYWQSKRWPKFAELADQLKKRGYRVVCFGSADEAVAGAENLTGGSIEEMARNMRMCSWFVSNDSGVMNIANALGIPVLSIFGPTEVLTRRPYSTRNACITVGKKCAPCEVLDPKFFKSGKCNCIADIDVSEVLSAFDEMRSAFTS